MADGDVFLALADELGNILLDRPVQANQTVLH
jgi:hypothetical protein